MESDSSDDDEPLNNKKAPNVMNFYRVLLKIKIIQNKPKSDKKNTKPIVQEIQPNENEESKFDTKCKFEFPAFVAPETQNPTLQIKNSKSDNASSNAQNKKKQEAKNNKPQQQAKQKKIDSTNAWEKQNNNPFLYYSTENKVSKKALNEEFPSLGGNNIANKGILSSFTKNILFIVQVEGRKDLHLIIMILLKRKKRKILK